MTEYAGTVSHSVNYGYSASESHVVNGPSGMPTTTYKSWFWLYRNNNTVSLNIVLGSRTTDGSDSGQFRSEVAFSGYLGTPSVIVRNDNSTEVPDSFALNFNWSSGYDDGAVLGGITPVPEPYEYGLIGVLGLLGFAAYDRRLKVKKA